MATQNSHCISILLTVANSKALQQHPGTVGCSNSRSLEQAGLLSLASSSKTGGEVEVAGLTCLSSIGAHNFTLMVTVPQTFCNALIEITLGTSSNLESFSLIESASNTI